MNPFIHVNWRDRLATTVALLAATLVVPSAHADIPYTPVIIYYDQASPSDNDGKIGVNALRNLLGHFKTTISATNVSSYTAGQLNQYEAVFYIGSVFDNTNIPAAFTNDVMASTTTVVWLHHNLWKLPGITSGTNRFGIRYNFGDADLAGYDTVNYKGEWLYKNGAITRIAVSNFVEVLATATCRTNGALPAIPYAVHSSNFWYIADSAPRGQMLADRSLVLADLLHDILRAGTSAPHRALARIEDIAPALTSKTDVSNVSAALRNIGVNAHFGIIPRYRDPLGKYTNAYPADLPMSQNRAFLRTLCAVLRDGGALTDHGYTHESGDAESGSGYEFWDSARTNTLPYDSWVWCNGRVTNALNELLFCGFPVQCWETPHYEASLIDYTVFPDTYRYSHERMRNFAAFTETMSRPDLETASLSNNIYSSQWFPYVIHKSSYGNMFLPENIDRFSTNATDANGLLLTVSNKVDYARKLAVVRDAVTAFYYHPQFGDANLTNIVLQIMGLGYTFAVPADLSREEPVPTHTNADGAAGNTVRVFTTSTNLFADLVVGDSGAVNRVNVTNGVAVANEEALLGIGPGSYSNLVYVADTGSVWTSRRPIYVGRRGPANGVTVQRGGRVEAPETVLGSYPESFGNAALLQDSNSAWSDRYGFVVGQNAASNGLVVQAGGRVAGQYGEIGATSNANNNFALVTDPGSVWSNQAYVVVGNSGSGNSLTILSSGRVASAFGFVGVKSTANSNTVLVSGPGSCWTNTASLMVGIDGRGNSLTISNGSCVSCANAVAGNYDNAAGNRIDIQNAGATLLVQQDLTVGADGASNTVRVAAGGLAQCGSVTIGRDNPGAGNELVITGGTVAATAVNVLNGRLNLAVGSLQATSMLVGPAGRIDLAPGFVLQGNGSLTNQGTISMPTNYIVSHALVLSQNGSIQGLTGNGLTLARDFACSSTNAGLDLLRSGLTFTTGAVHTLQMDSQDRGANLTGFHNNHALGRLTADGTLQITGTVYAWELAGGGALQVGTNSRLYYVTSGAWSGNVVLTGGTVQRVPVKIGSANRQTGGAFRLAWPSAATLNFQIDWLADLVTSNYLWATNFVTAASNTVWDDTGGTNRPAPSVTPQRSYRLKVWP